MALYYQIYLYWASATILSDIFVLGFGIIFYYQIHVYLCWASALYFIISIFVLGFGIIFYYQYIRVELRHYILLSVYLCWASALYFIISIFVLGFGIIFYYQYICVGLRHYILLSVYLCWASALYFIISIFVLGFGIIFYYQYICVGLRARILYISVQYLWGFQPCPIQTENESWAEYGVNTPLHSIALRFCLSPFFRHFVFFNPLSAGDAFKRIHTVFPQLKFDRNWTNMHV